MDMHFADAGCDTFPQFHLATTDGESISYRASPNAIRSFGHGAIIDALKLIVSDNVDAVPMAGSDEQLCIVRSVATGEVIVLGEAEYRQGFGFPMPSQPSAANP